MVTAITFAAYAYIAVPYRVRPAIFQDCHHIVCTTPHVNETPLYTTIWLPHYHCHTHTYASSYNKQNTFNSGTSAIILLQLESVY